MTEVAVTSAKEHGALAQEWDRLAEERHRQIVSGEDISFAQVIVPATWRLLNGCDYKVVLDIGCGTGELTLQLAHKAAQVIAIEPSHFSMEITRSVCGERGNVHYLEMTLEDAAKLSDRNLGTVAVAVMTLMTAPDLQGFANALASVLKTQARFVALLTHPCFWPRYWGYESQNWFAYDREIFIEAPFAISKRRTAVRTTHIHRPLEQYITVFANAGFRLEALAEPLPPPEIEALYPARWQFPRFIGLRWEKVV